MSGIYVLGAGGHGKVVISTIRAMGLEVEAVLDDDRSLWGSYLSGVEVTGPIDSLRGKKNPKAIIAIGINHIREKIATRLDEVEWISAIHPSAVIDGSVKIGPGTAIFAGAVVQPDSTVGNHVIINTGATVDHDCVLEDFVHIAPGCHLAGNVSLRRGAFMGIGSCAVPGTTVGPWTTVGAGGAVIADLPGNAVAVGVPAKEITALPSKRNR
ncbi:acetyltransferase [Dethiosulfovibrio salsuginis]|uniref:Sugar O-acyltransferase, sialic acid O-acetyltransferase NeuD family n=1 Tax=Dethiosulfovibrio salsuginis TaxID=561720 RepID=A0A1X7IQB8_9BACT|nr:acetyltransferase [Dethiosulfovibrio salsuginis]SMG17014.1 sugar O-acyltransferase, sialic acid O-acetyltransferase NeuD family [Dethiosulfovibrio salsuginis]